MSVKDVIKNSVYQNLAGGTGLSVVEIGLIFILACLIGTYIYMVYKLTSKAAFFQETPG